jgi:hypothetical protein
MFTWLVLLAVVGFVFHLNSRLRRLEERFEDLQAYQYAPAAAEFAAPAVEEVPAPAAEPPDIPEPRRPAVVLHADTRPPEVAVEPTEQLEDDEQPEPRSWKPSISFEELFGRRLPIWAGGITLAVAGMLIVKLSIDSGLLTPPIRVFAGLLFGALLIVGAEAALRFEERVRDPRVRQALAGAGVASLYASILVAVNLYHLIAPLTAMLGMAAVTALALFLSMRFGPPSALLGLAGGLAAPAMVGSTEPNVPLLSVYLSLAVGGLCTLSRNQRWAWLGISALVGGFGWGILLLIGGVLDTPSAISLGLYVLLLGVAIPALGFAGTRKSQLQLVSGILAAAQMAALVATGGFAIVNWALFALLSVALIWLATRDAQLSRLPAVGLVVAMLLMGAWNTPGVGSFALVLGGFVLIYGAPAVRRLWRSGGVLEGAEIGALGLGALLLPMFHFHRADGSNDALFGLLGFGSAAAVGACAALGWTNASRRDDARFALLSIVTAVLLSGAALLLLPIWAAGVAISVVGLGLLHLGQLADDPRFEPAAWIFAAVGILTYPVSQLEVAKDFPNYVGALHWGAQAAVAGMFAWRARFTLFRLGAQFLAPLFAYLALEPLLPLRVEPLIAPVLLVATVWYARELRQRLVPAMASSLLIILAWALEPLATWSMAAAVSIAGMPMLVSDVPLPLDVLTQLLVPATAIAAATLLAVRLRRLEQIGAWAFAGVLGGVAVHSLYKTLFAIGTSQAFVTLGLAERTLWELALAGLALLTYRMRRPVLALVLAIAAAAHEAFYTLLVHNPLWSAQAVGGWPLVNLLVPVYALALGFTVAARRALKPISEQAVRAVQVLQMALVVLFAFSELRQLFHGTLLSAPGLPVGEDILRSILAIALAIGFLLWGIARQQRDWRIASLALMLGAVGKVFLFDASGLAGVTRIASFVALGLSLIGIGWLYSRHLGSDKAAVPA